MIMVTCGGQAPMVWQMVKNKQIRMNESCRRILNTRWIAWRQQWLFDSFQHNEQPSLIPAELWREGGGKGAVKWKNESLQATRQKAETDLNMGRERDRETIRQSQRERGETLEPVCSSKSLHLVIKMKSFHYVTCKMWVNVGRLWCIYTHLFL